MKQDTIDSASSQNWGNSSMDSFDLPRSPNHPLPPMMSPRNPGAARGMRRNHSASSSTSSQQALPGSTHRSSSGNNRRNMMKKAKSENSKSVGSTRQQYKAEDIIFASVVKAELSEDPGLELKKHHIDGKIYVKNVHGLFQKYTNIESGQRLVKIQDKFVEDYPGGLSEITKILQTDKEIDVQVTKHIGNRVDSKSIAAAVEERSRRRPSSSSANKIPPSPRDKKGLIAFLGIDANVDN